MNADELRARGYTEIREGVWEKPQFLPDVLGEPARVVGVPVDRERKLHEDIMDWCDSQWPRWKYIHSRMDAKSTIQLGCQDFTIFGPHPICILVECKKKDGKIDPDQRNWIAEMKAIGWTVHVIRSMEEFKHIVA